MNARHTPGPWRWRDIGRQLAVNAGPQGRCVALIDNFGYHASADSHLIAAAPDMLEALYAARIVLDANTQAYAQVNAAIKKATGNA